MQALIVREPFGDYAKGQAITDPADIAKVQAAGQAHFCTPTTLADDFLTPEEPAPDAPPKGGAKPKSGSDPAPNA